MKREQKDGTTLAMVKHQVMIPWASVFRGGGSSLLHFSRWWPNPFSRSPKVVKFHFTNSKLREKHFSTQTLIRKYRISQSRGGSYQPLPPSSANLLRRFS